MCSASIWWCDKYNIARGKGQRTYRKQHGSRKECDNWRMTQRRKILIGMLVIAVGMPVNGWEWIQQIMEKTFGKG